MENVSTLPNLRILDLGYNQIRHIAGVRGLQHLRQLYLGRNKIEAIEVECSSPFPGIGTGRFAVARVGSSEQSHPQFLGSCLSHITGGIVTVLDTCNLQIPRVQRHSGDHRAGGAGSAKHAGPNLQLPHDNQRLRWIQVAGVSVGRSWNALSR